MTEKVTTQKKPSEEEHPQFHLVLYAILYSIGLFMCCLAVTGHPLFMIPIVAMVAATVVLTAAWSVLGAGSYLARTFRVHLVGLIPAVGTLLGLFLLSLGPMAPGLSGLSDYLFLAGMVVVGIPIVSVASQIVFWFFRGVFGWQFVWRDSKPELAFDLKDIFAVTFAFAICFAIPQVSVGIMGYVSPLEDSPIAYRQIPNDDGSFSSKAVQLTSEQRQQNRRQNNRDRNNMVFQSYGIAALIALGISLFSFPVFAIVFFAKSEPQGWFMTGTYVGCCFAITCTAIIVLTPGGPNTGVLFFYMLVLIVGYLAALCMPLATSRINGFRLTSMKREEKNVAKPVASPNDKTRLNENAF